MRTVNSRSQNDRKDRTWIAGILLALTASLYCLTPVLALLSGVGGIAATFSWLEPVRPYLTGVTLLVLGSAWYLKFKPRKKEEIECDCEGDGKASFWQSKIFLGMVTILAIGLFTFPNYAHIFYPKTDSVKSYELKKTDVPTANKTSINKIEFLVKGMTCRGCEAHVKHAVNELEGITEVSVSYKEGKAIVSYDKSETTPAKIKQAINSTGYQVVDHK